MIPDITQYDARRNRHGRLKLGVREPNGKISRSAVPSDFMVYFVTLDDGLTIKVGRTKNLKERFRVYRNNSGCEPYCVAQILVATEVDSKTLERQAVNYLRTRFGVKAGREWFSLPTTELLSVLAEVAERSAVRILEVRGMPNAESKQPLSTYANYEANSVAVQYHQKRKGRA